MLDHDLDVLRDLHVDQISFYPLMTAPTARHKMEKSMGTNDPRLRHPMYQRILERVLGAEYHAASAWCFSRNQGMFDEYIIEEDDYVGVGSGAFSYVGGAYLLDDVLAEPLLPPRRGRAVRHHPAPPGQPARTACATTTSCGCSAAS